MEDPYRFLELFNDDFLWSFFQSLDFHQLVGVRGRSNRFDLLIDEEEFIRAYNLRPGGSVWTFTHFHRREVPHNHRFVGTVLGNLGQQRVTYYLRDFGFGYLDHGELEVRLLGGFRSLLLLWHARTGFIVCNTWNMTSRVFEFPYEWHMVWDRDAVLTTRVREDRSSDQPFQYLIRYVRITDQLNVIAYSFYSDVGLDVRHSEMTEMTTRQEMENLVLVRRVPDFPPPHGMFMFLSDFQPNLYHMYEFPQRVISALDLAPQYPNVIEPGYVYQISLRPGNTSYMLIEDSLLRVADEGRIFLRIRLCRIIDESMRYTYISSVPSHLIPQGTHVYAGSMLNEGDGFVEFTSQINDHQNLWTCLILRFDIQSQLWNRWIEQREIGETTIAGHTTSFRRGIFPRV